jgi:hypothetical protein
VNNEHAQVVNNEHAQVVNNEHAQVVNHVISELMSKMQESEELARQALCSFTMVTLTTICKRLTLPYSRANKARIVDRIVIAMKDIINPTAAE